MQPPYTLFSTATVILTLTMISACGGSSTTSSEDTERFLSTNQINNFLLSWDMPTTREDGRVLELSEIAQITITYSNSDTDTSKIFSLTDPSLSSFKIDDLPSGSWRFELTVCDIYGICSAPSDPVFLSIP